MQSMQINKLGVHMRIQIQSLLIISLASQAIFSPAMAAQLMIKQAENGKGAQANTMLSTTRIGKVALPSGSIKIRGQAVEIQAVPDWLFDRHTVLTGKLLKIDLKSSQNEANEANKSNAPSELTSAQMVQGLVYIDGGDYLKDLGLSQLGTYRNDVLTTTDGQILNGTIRGVSTDSLTFDTLPGKTRNVPFAQIADLTSKRIYKFEAPAQQVRIDPDTGNIICQAGTATIMPSKGMMLAMKGQPITPRSTLAGTEGGIKKGAIAGMIAVDVAQTLAPIIAMPIAIPLGERQAKNTLTTYGQFDVLNATLDLPPQPSAIARF